MKMMSWSRYHCLSWSFTRIRARLSNEETSGVFEGLDETGALLLRENAGPVRKISAGEVFFA